MDVFDIHDMKAEKANAMLRYHRFRKIAELFRIIELLLAVILFSWITTRLPLVIGVASDYLRQLIPVIVSPLFIFLIGNLIVLTLVLKSGQITDTDNISEIDITGTDFYEESANNNVAAPPVIEPEEIVYQDKRITSEVIKPITTNEKHEIKVKLNPDFDVKVYRRSKSENLMTNEADKGYSKLKRSETEVGRRVVENYPVTEKVVDDELSNEEFKRRIEGFIARQINKFHHEERLAIVTHNS
ncbi:uncharacterized protein LOC143548306 [Bidens hawaiensis]|uniref:uncharacterized protein LOC143548306 n=1 Tax=Bidens hawaiensis TaxID=980011 RepID=UPI004049E880